MSNKKVHIVVGETGEYSDHTKWMVKAFSDKRKAKRYAIKCKKLIEEQKFVYSEYKHDKWEHPLDPYFSLDYTETYYHVESVLFEE